MHKQLTCILGRTSSFGMYFEAVQVEQELVARQVQAVRDKLAQLEPELATKSVTRTKHLPRQQASVQVL